MEPEDGPWSEACSLVCTVVAAIAALGSVGVFIAWLLLGDGWLALVTMLATRTVAGVTVLLLPLLLLLALAWPLRGPVALAFSALSMMLCLCWWAMSFVYVLALWGPTWAVVGFVFLSVGEIPLAFVALLVHGAWRNLGDFVLGGISVLATAGLAHFLAAKADRRLALVRWRR